METYHDFRGFIEEAKKISEWRLIEDADCRIELAELLVGEADMRQQQTQSDRVGGRTAPEVLEGRLQRIDAGNSTLTAIGFDGITNAILNTDRVDALTYQRTARDEWDR